MENDSQIFRDGAAMLENLRLTLCLKKQWGPGMFHADHGLTENTSQCVLEGMDGIYKGIEFLHKKMSSISW